MTATATPTGPAHAPALRDVRGPSATGGGWRRFAHLTWTIAVTDFRLSYFGSALGYLWSLARPLLTFAVLLVVFTQIFDAGEGVEQYPTLLLLGVVLYTFFAEATSGAVTSIVNREALVRKMQFPRLVIPLSVVLTAAMNLAVNLLPVVVFALASGVRIRATWLLLPVALVALVAFTIGVSLILAAAYVRFRDIAPIWVVLSQVIFYASTVMFTIDLIPEGWERPTLANPLAALIQLTRAWIVGGEQGGPADEMGGLVWGLLPLGIGLLIVAAGVWLFNREAPRIAERL